MGSPHPRSGKFDVVSGGVAHAFCGCFRPRMTQGNSVTAVPPPSGTVTFLFSDIEGSTRRWDRDRAAMREALRLHDKLMRAALEAHNGYVFKTIGDAFCVAFATSESAAAAALDAQRALGAADFAAVAGLRVRMAINTGTADERDGDYFGPTVNRVARLLALGHGGQVLLSGIAASLVRESPPPHATLADLGEHSLKDLEGYERVYQLVAPDLQREFPDLHAPKALGPWLVPDALRTRYFTGREDILALLRQQLLVGRTAALSGLGGVGKTQTAIEYAARHRAEYPAGVFWVNSETASGLVSGFVEIAKTLRLPTAESNDQEQIVRAALEWLNRTERWLLILDNVDDRRDVRPFVPGRGTGDLLITSRESVFPELGIPSALEIRDLDRDEAVRFLLARTGRKDAEPDDRAAAAELAADLGNLPLALEQAAAYIVETNATFAAYLSAFRKRRVTLLEKAGGLIAHDTIAVTWAANFEAVQRASRAAADVLRISALLAPDAIPFELFLYGAKALGDSIADAFADPDDLVIAEVLRPLARYSLIRSDATSRAFSVHRLVQAIVWTAVPESERPTYVERAVHALDAVFPEGEYANFERCERLLPHAASIAGWVDSYQGQPGVAVRVLNRAGRYLNARGRYAEAQALHERALAIGERTLSPDDPELAQSLNNLGNVHDAQGRYADAEALHRRALAIRVRALGPDHSDVAHSLNNIANAAYDRGRYAEAQPLYEHSLAIWERAFGPDHPKVASSLNNLGLVHLAQGRHDEAEALHQRALAIWENAYGPDRPDVASSLANLAETYDKQGRYAEARVLQERSVAILERTLGPDHPETASSLHGLANVRVGLGHYAEAEPLFQRALAIRERAFGPDHTVVAETLAGLANLYSHDGRYAEAAPRWERALEIRERALGPDHMDVSRMLVGLAIASQVARPYR